MNKQFISYDNLGEKEVDLISDDDILYCGTSENTVSKK